MICLTKCLYCELTVELLECKDCMFYEECDDEAKDGDGDA